MTWYKKGQTDTQRVCRNGHPRVLATTMFCAKGKIRCRVCDRAAVARHYRKHQVEILARKEKVRRARGAPVMPDRSYRRIGTPVQCLT